MTADDYKRNIEAAITAWFAREKRVAPTNEARVLLDRIQAVILRGGKRLRPELLYRTYVAYGGENPAILLDLGVALELYHQFLLVHDDIIDRDTVRYDGPNVIGYYDNEAAYHQSDIPVAMGVLAGDLLFSSSQQIIIDSPSYNEAHTLQLIALFTQANASEAYGQQLDALNSGGIISDFTEEKLLLNHELKAAAYTTELPMLCAATLLDLDDTERQKVIVFAKSFGILFQLVDDHSDYFQNASASNNRPKYRDFKQGKITYPLYAAFAMANPKQTEIIDRRFGDKALSDKDMTEVVQILEDCGAKDRSRVYLERHFEQVLKALRQLAMDSKQRTYFTELVEKYRV